MYVGMVRYNIDTIVTALQTESTDFTDSTD